LKNYGKLPSCGNTVLSMDLSKACDFLEAVLLFGFILEDLYTSLTSPSTSRILGNVTIKLTF
jgi:hypothetical protein